MACGTVVEKYGVEETIEKLLFLDAMYVEKNLILFMETDTQKTSVHPVQRKRGESGDRLKRLNTKVENVACVDITVVGQH